MKTKHCKLIFLFIIVTFAFTKIYAQSALIINHTSTNISSITIAEINNAKSTLHIAYGHTSHGSQVTDGMSGLVEFANGGGKGLALPHDIFAWNHGGSGGALDLHDYAMGGDVGYYPDWVNNTRSYLDNPSNSDVNVIIWSWCGQVSGKYSSGTLNSEYLTPMTQLETDYPNVKFVYMTGHLDHWDDANNKAANNTIRQYCNDNHKILFDFADIESYNPDGTFYQYADGACNYYSSAADGSADGNWAVEWRTAHTENVDWYNCSSAHSDALNANQKAYAVWRLWVGIANLLNPLPVELTSFTASVSENKVLLNWQTATEVNNYGFDVERILLSPPLIKGDAASAEGDWEKVGFVPGSGNSNSPKDYSFVDENPPAGSLQYRLKQIDTNGNFKYYSNTIEIYYSLTGVAENSSNNRPKEFALEQNYPNPFNPVTKIKYQIPSNPLCSNGVPLGRGAGGVSVSLKVYNVLGTEVATLVNENKQPGYYDVKFDGSHLSSGIYIYRLNASSLETGEQYVKSAKMVLMK